MRPRPEPGFPPAGRWGWNTGAWLGKSLLGFWLPLTRAGSELVPDGPMVVAANHFSHLDPVATGIAVGRPIRYLAVDELYGNSRFFDNLTLWLGAIPLSRTSVPLGALRTALRELEAGGSIGVYPEGVRVWRWRERPPKRGAAWLARRTGVPLVPVAICGSEEAMGRGSRGRISRRPIHAEVCEPIFPAEHEGSGDPLGSMMSLWKQRIDAVVGPWYGRSEP